MAKPNVLVVGFPRCGTTFLYNVLKQYPEVSLSREKEVEYFSRYAQIFCLHNWLKNPYYDLPKSYYFSLFKKKPIIVGFAITACFEKESAMRIKKILGENTKIILLKRRKWDYLKSLHKLMLWHGEITNQSFQEFYTNNEKRLKELSDFNGSYNNFREHFKDVIQADIVDDDTEKELKKIFEFLDLNYRGFEKRTDTHKRDKFSFRRINRMKRLILLYTPFLYLVWTRIKLLKKITSKKLFLK